MSAIADTNHMKPYRQFKPFQIRWAEKMYQGSKHYLTRWTFLFFGYSIRVHHWIASDVGPHFHDHGCDFLSILIKGHYTNCTPNGNRHIKAPSIWYATGDKQHRLEIPPEGAWTILLCSRQYRKWGFWVNNHLWRPLRYFHKFGERS
jgi:hypothetical protein